MLSFGFDDVCICPHQPADHCKCRKPGTDMIERMVRKYCLNIPECSVIGDRWSDMLAGINAGLQSILVKTDAGNDALEIEADKWDQKQVSFIAENLLDASKWIVTQRSF